MSSMARGFRNYKEFLELCSTILIGGMFRVTKMLIPGAPMDSV